MILGTLLSAALLVGMPQQGDTVLAARSADVLDVELGVGAVVVRAWDRNEVRIQSAGNDLRGFDIDTYGDRVSVEADLAGLFEGVADLEIDVPVRFDVFVEGLTVEVAVEGVVGDVDIESLAGDVSVRGTGGDVTVETMASEIRVYDSRGDLDLSSAGFGVEVRGASGDIDVETVGGSIELVDVESSMVEAASLGGRIHFDGVLDPDGSYYFESHGGAIDLLLAPGASATFTLEDVMGNVEADYPGLTLQSRDRHDRTFVVGGGRADVEIETFSGLVRIRERARRD